MKKLILVVATCSVLLTGATTAHSTAFQVNVGQQVETTATYSIDTRALGLGGNNRLIDITIGSGNALQISGALRAHSIGDLGFQILAHNNDLFRSPPDNVAIPLQAGIYETKLIVARIAAERMYVSMTLFGDGNRLAFIQNEFNTPQLSDIFFRQAGYNPNNGVFNFTITDTVTNIVGWDDPTGPAPVPVPPTMILSLLGVLSLAGYKKVMKR